MHNGRYQRHGDPLYGGPVKRLRPRNLRTEAEVFAWFMPGDPPPAPSPIEGCWDWPSALRMGYGAFSLGNKLYSAHHVSYRIYHGPIREGLYVLHSCDRRICVQPAHLSAGTHQRNMDEMVTRGRSLNGVRNPNTRLTEEDVVWIREQASLSNREMAAILGVAKATVNHARTGRNWRYLPRASLQ